MLSQEQKLKLIEYIDKADFYKSAGDCRSAIACYEELLKIDPSREAVYSILANLYSKVFGDDSLDKQIFYYEKLLELNPKSRVAQHGLAFNYEKLKQNDNAEKFYKMILENDPTDIDFYNYGMFLIHTGNFIEGHKYFTRRFNIDDKNLEYPMVFQADKKWDLVSDISAKTLLVHYEQGFGDSIMYCRFLPELKERCRKLIFVVQKELYSLIKNSPQISNGIEIVTDIEGVEYDYNMALLDAPFVLGTKSSEIPFGDGYLVANAKITHRNNFNIGISCSGDKYANYESRDIDINKFKFLSEIKGIKLYSLRKDENISLSWIESLGSSFRDFSDTACAIKNMDLVISTDNVILNLAGALGVRTIGLFNYYTNYRWFKTEGENVGWYNSVMPLQCEVRNNRDEIFERLNSILRAELT